MNSKKINRNIVANIFGRFWGVISIYIFIPLYIDVLGVKVYGVIGFYAVLEGLLIFADTGLTATLKRELAKGDESTESRKYKYKILRSIESVYFLIVFIIIGGVFFGSNFIVNSWLNIQDLDIESTKQGIQIMGAALGLNFLSALYQGGILGLERQVESNIFHVLWGIIKNGGAVLAVLFIDKTLSIFFLWQLGINLIYVVSLRFFVIKSLKQRSIFLWSFINDIKLLKDVWKYAFGMLLIAIIAALNSQFDKLVLSKLLSISELGIYTVAYSLAMIPIALSGPISNAIFPRFVKYFESNDNLKLEKTFTNSFKIVLLIAGTTATTLCFYSEFIINIWTQDKDIASSAYIPASLLLLGQMLLSFQIIPFNLALANGNTKINVRIGVIGLFFLMPLVFFMTKFHGMFGAALSWLIYSFVITPIYIILILKKTTTITISSWFLLHFLKPLLIIIIGNFIFLILKPLMVSNSYFDLGYIAISAGIVFMFTFRITFNVRIRNTLTFIKNELFA